MGDDIQKLLEPFDAVLCDEQGRELGAGDRAEISLSGGELQPGLTMLYVEAVVPPGFRMTATSTPGLSIELHTLGRSHSVGVTHSRSIDLNEGAASVIHTDQPETWSTFGSAGQKITAYSLFADSGWFERNHLLLGEYGFSKPSHLAVQEIPLPPHMVMMAAAAPSSDYKGSLYKLYNEGVALQLLGHVLAACARSESNLATALADRRRLRRAEKARDHLLDRLDQDLSLGDVARELGVSPRQLQRDFQAVFGTTPFAWVREQRLRRAAARLAAGEVSVTEAAFDAGYSGTSGFHRATRAILGVNPMDLVRR